MKGKRAFFMVCCLVLLICLSNAVQAKPTPPILTVITFGTQVGISWSSTPGETGYTLSYAAAPYTGPGSIASTDMGTQTSLAVNLWPGASYYLAVQSRDASSTSDYSNLEYINIPAQTQASGTYQVFAFNDLGMHCYDPDFSVFSILPLFNVLHAQVIRRGSSPQIIGPPVVVKYRAMADPTGSVNTTSIGKTNFWDYVMPLFGADPAPDTGLAGATMPGAANQPRSFTWTDGGTNWFSAEGLPMTSFDDKMNLNFYPLMDIQAVDPTTAMPLSSLPVVVPVSNEMACDVCHATGNVAARLQGVQWSANTDSELQFRENILLLHDYRNSTNLYNSQPVLCASCHYSYALDLNQQGPVGPQVTNPNMSRAIHNYHASRITTLPPGGNVCFYCHPGEKTQCARGAMAAAGLVCLDCHGNLNAVGQASRKPWRDLPKCQSCHTGDALNHLGGQIVGRSTYTNSPDVATFIIASNKLFAEQTDTTLFRNSVGHHGVVCESCHGSPHAIWPTRTLNDNLTAWAIQGHDGVITECRSCHGTGLSNTLNGPHGMHNVNSQSWVNGHGERFASQHACGICHGAAGLGTVLSTAAAARTFSVEDRGTVTIPKGMHIGCNLCHANYINGGGG
jgi:hypothetical protein